MKNFVCFALLNLLALGTILVTGCDAPVKGTIEGRVTLEGAPVSGIEVHLLGSDYQDTRTDGEGRYAFDVKRYGLFTIRLALADVSENYPSSTPKPAYGYVQIDEENQYVTGIDFELVEKFHHLSGKIEVDGTPLPGAFLIMDGDEKRTAKTDNHGEYLIQDLVNGKYTITPILKGYDFTQVKETVVMEFQDREDVDFQATVTAHPEEACWNSYYDTAYHNDSVDDLSGYTSVTGYLFINNTSLTDLTALNSLNRVEKPLTIMNNASLSSLEGLNHLETAYSINIMDNDALTNLEGLDNLDSTGQIWIKNNAHLQSLDGLGNLRSAVEIAAVNNPELISLAAISHLTSIEKIEITGNDSLETVEALGALLPETMTISSNASLISLEGLYENRTTIEGSLYIVGNPVLSDLKGLEHIESVSGTLLIQKQESRTILDGLNNLISVNELNIRSNGAIETLEGLSNLASINHLIIYNNDAMKSLAGLGHLESVDVINIFDNDAMENLSGLENLESVYGINIFDNDSLETLEGLNRLSSVRSMDIRNNDSLVSLEALYNLVSVEGTLYIYLEDKNLICGKANNYANDALPSDSVKKLLDHIGDVPTVTVRPFIWPNPD